MSANITRIVLDGEPSGSATDWARLRAMDDDAIDTAIAADPDSYALADKDFAGAQRGFKYEIYKAAGGWRWRLIDDEGETLADGARIFAVKQAALDAISAVRAASLSGKVAA
jgi:uncharacterized protein YegP (UPF0339 family)